MDKTVVLILALLIAIVALALMDKIPVEVTGTILSTFAGYLAREITGINKEIHKNGGNITVPDNGKVTVEKELK